MSEVGWDNKFDKSYKYLTYMVVHEVRKKILNYSNIYISTFKGNDSRQNN